MMVGGLRGVVYEFVKALGWGGDGEGECEWEVVGWVVGLFEVEEEGWGKRGLWDRGDLCCM